ncbi:CLUMA_CG012814, isoform A [Clunio marinus]|uniref:Mitochondrial inner membrane protease subunit n=1 Tax=Clunio marinus TaxID=568069 RepID=A0A1J1IGV4_9DIPT|nr:CLUMA_CG012814, isoform A [Clunio marinus]
MYKILKSVIISIPIGITCADVCGYIARVDGESMKPTLNPNTNDSEYVFLNKFMAKDYNVNRGEIVSLISPKDPQQRLIKRVIGTQGDTILTLGYKERYIKVPIGHFWIEGDYSKNSLDSNTFGPVPVGLLTAKATHIVWPPSRWRALKSEPIRHPLKLGNI